MDTAGQGRLFGIRRKDSKTDKDSKVDKDSKTDNDSKAHFITLNPFFAWTHKRHLPTKVPDNGQHGGIIQLDQTKRKGINNNYVEFKSHQTIHVGGLGHGAGAIIDSGSGPVLIGAASFNSNMGFILWIVVLIFLVISSIIWAVIHMICSERRKDQCYSFSRRRQKENWDKNFDDQNKSLNNNHLAALMMKSAVKNENAGLSFESKSQTLNIQSMQSATQAFLQPMRTSLSAGLRSSSNSLWSSKTQFATNSFSSVGLLCGGLSHNTIVESQRLGFIFTISTENCPRTYQWKNCTRVTHCLPSMLDECQEIFLLFQEQMLIGKMRNRRHKRTSDQFFIQIWNTDDGTLIKNLPNEQTGSFMTCDAVCPVRDEFLVLIRQGKILVWNVISNSTIFGTVLDHISDLTRLQWDIQPTKVEMEVVVLSHNPHNSTTNIYSINFDQLLQGSLQVIHKSFSYDRYLFSLVPSSSLIVASGSGDIVKWDFSKDTTKPLFKNTEEHIHKIVVSPSGELMALQLDQKILIWMIHQWTQLSEIFQSYFKVCAVTFNLNGFLLAVALDDRSIKIYNSSNGDLQLELKTHLPTVDMIFSSDNLSLIVIADRASHHQLFIFDITVDL